jgi:hypothetical protein
MKRTVTDEQISWAIDHDSECHALWLEAIELARQPAPPPKPKVTLVELSGKVAEAAAANPNGVKVKVLDAEGVTTVGGWQEVRVLDAPIASPTGRPEYPNYFPAAGAVHVYNPIDRLKDE